MNFLKVLQNLLKGPLKARPKMYPVHYGSETINVGSYMDLGPNPNPPMADYPWTNHLAL